MTHRNLLVELFVEELPPKALKILGEAFAGVLFEQLRSTTGATRRDRQYSIVCESPRRLAVHIPSVVRRRRTGRSRKS